MIMVRDSSWPTCWCYSVTWTTCISNKYTVHTLFFENHTHFSRKNSILLCCFNPAHAHQFWLQFWVFETGRRVCMVLLGEPRLRSLICRIPPSYFGPLLSCFHRIPRRHPIVSSLLSSFSIFLVWPFGLLFAPPPQRRAPYMWCFSELGAPFWNGVTSLVRWLAGWLAGCFFIM